MEKSLASLKLSDLPIDAQLATKAAKAVSDYAAAAGQAASFVEEDAFNATMFMTDAEQKFATAQQDVSTLVATAIELEGALDEQMMAMIHTRLVTISVGAGVAALRPHEVAQAVVAGPRTADVRGSRRDLRAIAL